MRSPVAVRLRSPSAKPFRPMRPPKVTLPPPSRPVTSSTRRPLASNDTLPLIDSSECGSEKWRSRPSVSVALPAKIGLLKVPAIWAFSCRRSAAAQIAEEALQDAEVRVARRLHVDRLVLEAQPAVELQLRSLAREPEPADLEDVLIERQLDRTVVAHAIVEELQVELLDARVDDELIQVGQLAEDADRAADDRGREGREARLEETHVGIERRLAKTHRELGVHLGRERDASEA